jgi:hypothetical protein
MCLLSSLTASSSRSTNHCPNFGSGEEDRSGPKVHIAARDIRPLGIDVAQGEAELALSPAKVAVPGG